MSPVAQRIIGSGYAAAGAPPSVFLSTYSPESIGAALANAPTSGAWPAANRGLYVPFHVPVTCTAYRMFVLNGSAVANGTVDMAIYETASGDAKPSARLVTAGATTTANANALQFLDIADTTLVGGGLYFMGISMSSGSDTAFRTSGLGVLALQAIGTFQQAAVATLPDPAVPVAPTLAYTPLFGIALRSTP